MYTPPTTAELKDQIIADIEGAIGQTTPLLPVAFIRILAGAIAGVQALAYRFQAWIYRQIFPDTAELASLMYWGERYGIVRRASVAAIHTITISGTDGTNVPAGTLWSVGALNYQQVALAVISGGVATAQVECLDSGDETTQANSVALSLPSPIAGVTGAVIASTVVYGEDEETVDEYRARIQDRQKRQPQGGATGDYDAWAKEVAGVVKTRVVKVGTDVVVYPLVAATGSARIPSAGKLTEIQNYLQDPGRRPLCATVYALAATERAATLTITGLAPNSDAMKATVLAAWQDYCYAAYPKQFVDDVDATDVISLAAIWAILNSCGAYAVSVVLTISGIGAGISSYTLPKNEILAPGAITWA